MPFKPYQGETVDDPTFKPYEGETMDDPDYVPPEEPSFLGRVKDTVVEAGAQAINPLGKALEYANQIPGVKEVIPDFMAGTGPVATGVAKGGYTAARNTLQLGADIQDYIIPGDETPMSDLLSNVPKAEYEGVTENIVGPVTEIASGFALGNKAAALTKAAALGDDAARAVMKIVPEAAKGIVKLGMSIVKGGAQGVAGTAVTTAPGSTNVMVGEDSLAERIGIGYLTDGLPTDSPDSAQNALAARVNTALDGFITGMGVTSALKGLGAIYKIMPQKVIIDRMSPIWSEVAKIRVFFEQLQGEASKITGIDDKAALQQFLDRATELARAGRTEFEDVGTGAGRLQGDLGIPGVAPIDESLDTATTVARGATDTPLDQGIVTTLEKQAKLIGQKGRDTTAIKREAPTRALARALEQTQDILGGPKAAQTGAEKVQELGKQEVTKGKTQKGLTQTEVTNITEDITHKVSYARQLTKKQVDELFDQVPADAKYDPVSLTKIMAEEKKNISPDVKDLLLESDGSFKYLNKTVKTAVNGQIGKLEDLALKSPKQQKELKALKRLRDNINKDQIKHLEDSGRSDVVNAAKKAQEAWESRIAENRQGVVGQLHTIEDTSPFKLDEIKAKSHDALVKEIGNLEHPSHEKRLREVLSTDEGGRSNELIERYKKAKDKVAELDKIEEEVFGSKLREFYDQRAKPGTPNPVGDRSFQDLLDDPQSKDRIKYMVDLADEADDASVQKALEYSYAKALHKKLFSGHLTEQGAEVTTAPGVRSIQTNEGFLQAGDQIFKKNPVYMKTVKDIIELAHAIQRSSYTKAAPVSVAGKVVEAAQKGLKTAISPILGPLSHKGYIVKTYFGTLLDVIGPQAGVDRIADKLLSDGMEFAKAYDMLVEAGKRKGGKTEVVAKTLMNSLLRTNGERERFDKKLKEVQTNEQTDEVLKK